MAGVAEQVGPHRLPLGSGGSPNDHGDPIDHLQAREMHSRPFFPRCRTRSSPPVPVIGEGASLFMSRSHGGPSRQRARAPIQRGLARVGASMRSPSGRLLPPVALSQGCSPPAVRKRSAATRPRGGYKQGAGTKEDVPASPLAGGRPPTSRLVSRHRALVIPEGAVGIKTKGGGFEHGDRRNLARLEAKPGKEEEVATFLAGALPLTKQERTTTARFAIRIGPSTFGIFDVFPDDAGRDAHLVRSHRHRTSWRRRASTCPNRQQSRRTDVLTSKLAE